MNSNTNLPQLKKELQNIKSISELELIETKYLGRQGIINKELQKLSLLSQDKRKEKGQYLNRLKNEIVKIIDEKRQTLLSKIATESKIDITLPGKKYQTGSVHILTLAIAEISAIFEQLGFVRMSYPEIEWEYFAFDALNMGPNHPARDDFETFFIDTKQHEHYGRMILTPHTSSGQPREMLRLKQPPIRMINIAKTYRPNWDASHTPMFHQFEGMCVDKNINIVHLKGAIDYFVKEFFGEKRQIRLRPFHFQFTEPSFEVDITCGVCLGKGKIKNEKCRLCKSGWLELGGAGMIHPNVLRSGGIDPEKYSGWAFGIGIERTFMMKEGLKIDDLRIIYDNDIRFLQQF